MRVYPECIPCLIRQGLNAAEKLKLPEEKLFQIAQSGLKYLTQFNEFHFSPAYYAYHIQREVKRLTGEEDPFKEIKKISNRKALEILNNLNLEEILKEEPLRGALKLSAIGNILDFAILSEEEAFGKILQLLKKEFTVDDYESFKKDLKNSQRILILGDNAGEIVFDKVLVKVLKELGKEVVFVVKGKPILNDATLKEAKEVSMTQLCKVIDNGNDRVGTELSVASEEFLKEWEKADLVISKGQANFESLSSFREKTIYFLLTAKCNPVAREVGAKGKGNLVFKRNKPLAGK
ncbi:MAG TPA: DUF89 family protein [Aquificales bacterium]|nr:DUF89 family protein [Aquificales bacterium]